MKGQRQKAKGKRQKCNQSAVDLCAALTRRITLISRRTGVFIFAFCLLPLAFCLPTAGRITSFAMAEGIKDNLARVQATIAQAVTRAGRRPDEVRLIAVS